VKETTTLEELVSVASKSSRFESIQQKNLPFILEELKEKLKRKEKDHAKSRAKNASRFMDLLLSKKVPIEGGWAAVRSLVENHPYFSKVETEAERESIYEEYVRTVASGAEKKGDESSEEEGRIKEEIGEKEKERDRERAREREKEREREARKEDRMEEDKKLKRERSPGDDRKHKAHKKVCPSTISNFFFFFFLILNRVFFLHCNSTRRTKSTNIRRSDPRAVIPIDFLFFFFLFLLQCDV
jgi:hypothetical protein